MWFHLHVVCLKEVTSYVQLTGNFGTSNTIRDNSLSLIGDGLCFIVAGLYFPTDDQRVPKELRGMGVRIEDNVLITEQGYENFTSELPSSVTEIEDLLNES